MSIKYSVIISSANEPNTIGKAINQIVRQINTTFELILVAPDNKTLASGKISAKNVGKFCALKDHGRGKPAALNIAFKKAVGEILILTDGDVYVGENSISELLKPLSDKSIGASTGHPISLNQRNTILGLWSHFLTDAAHHLRTHAQNKHQFLDLSGYLIAIRKICISPIPPSTLADDKYLSQQVAKRKLTIAYAPKAHVYVKYPENLSDWFKQKKRSTIEYWQNDYSGEKSSRNFFTEVIQGILFVFGYPKNTREAIGISLLFLARLYLWSTIALISLKKCLLPQSSLKKLWVRVESTK